jgi:hypothetical protein
MSSVGTCFPAERSKRLQRKKRGRSRFNLEEEGKKIDIDPMG